MLRGLSMYEEYRLFGSKLERNCDCVVHKRPEPGNLVKIEYIMMDSIEEFICKNENGSCSFVGSILKDPAFETFVKGGVGLIVFHGCFEVKLFEIQNSNRHKGRYALVIMEKIFLEN